MRLWRSILFKGQSEKITSVLILHTYSEQELREHAFGGTQLIWKQKRFFEKVPNCKVKVVSLQDVGSFSSKILGYGSAFKSDKKVMSYVRRASERRWLLNLLFYIFTYYIAKVDFFFLKFIC